MYNAEEKIGVYSIAKFFTEELRRIFREQPVNDFGIDGIVEITKTDLDFKKRFPTGKLIGVQIKSGKSFFKCQNDDYINFNGNKRHLEYWSNYSIPVVVILYEKETNSAFWQVVDKATVNLTQKGFRLLIPKNNILNLKHRESLTSIAYFQNTYQYKLWQIQGSKDVIQLLLNQDLFLYVEVDGIRKSTDFHITLLITDEDCVCCPEIIHRMFDSNPNRFFYWFYLPEGKSLTDAIRDILPWGDLLLENSKFSDGLLIHQLVSTIRSYKVPEFDAEVENLHNKKSILKLACFLSDSYTFKLTLKANSLARSFSDISIFLDQNPFIKQRCLL